MRSSFSLFIFALAISCIVGLGCKDDGPTRIPCNGTSPTWNGNVLDIVANTCFGSSCHGAAGTGGDYTSYQLIKPHLTNLAFEIRVLENRTMPVGDVLPDSVLAILACWADNGFLEQ